MRRLVPALVRNRRLVTLFVAMVILPAAVFSALMVRAIANEQLRAAYGTIERQRQIVRLAEADLMAWLFSSDPAGARARAVLKFTTTGEQIVFPDFSLALPLGSAPRMRPFDAPPDPAALTVEAVTTHYYPRVQVFLRDLGAGRHSGAQYFLRLRSLVVRPQSESNGYVIGIDPVVEHLDRRLAELCEWHPFTARAWIAAAERSIPAATDTYGLVDMPFFEIAFANSGTPALMHVKQHAFSYALTALVVVTLLGSVFVHRAVSLEMRLSQLRKDFVAAVSHEFRSPLSSITLLAERLVSQRALGPDQVAEYHRIIQHDAQRLSALVSRLLEFGHIEEGRAPYVAAPLDLVTVTQEAIDALRNTVAPSRLRFTALTAEAPIRGDRTAISHAIQNLVENAAKYSPADAPIEVACSGRDDGYLVTVRDFGIGVPPREREEIFGRFYRGEGVIARNIQGVGIGLALVKHVMDAHRGAVSLESREGAGSTFTLRFPGSPPALASRAEGRT